MTFSINLDRAVVRALGQGVDRLMDGDLKDRSDAEGVITAMSHAGYEYDYSGHFTNRLASFVNGHMHPEGVWTDDLTDSEREKVIRDQGALLPEMDQAINESRYLDLPMILLESMADSIRYIRASKGLRYNPDEPIRDFVNNRGE